MDHPQLARLGDELVDWRFKGLPPLPAGTTIRDLAREKLNVYAGDLLLPALLLNDEALTNNLAVMAQWCADHGVEIAPHAKTSMTPQLLARHVAAGAWGFTVATTSQARVLHAFGFSRLILASQVVEAAAAEWIAAAQREGLDLRCLVDSPAGVRLLDELLGAAGAERVDVLLEVGYSGGRTGCRTTDEAIATAEAVRAARHLRLAGVEGFEGLLGLSVAPADGVAIVDGYLTTLRATAETLSTRGLFDDLDEVLLTAGGSAHFDRVVAILGDTTLAAPVRLVVRSGCYATHDAQMYEAVSPLAARGEGVSRLRAAFEVWGAVWSRPEPDLAIVGVGKRDASFDYLLPLPLAVVPRDSRIRRDVGAPCAVTAMNDQHIYLRVAPDDDIAVGDRVVFGISHPCTTFDKWRLIPVVDAEGTVIDAYQTFF